ncbi:hypothetical protein BHE90_010098 [Fusarium euwallaceae]|uniref:Protein kinase domain-containing protein n=1 Tax=Fusarium euwallaceae TaxID=1147111 RepID=A0A430LIA9_9HYPO|nr:hypothetical protein BHE90_010098 [Fusarium euwallaceae]
MPRRRRPSKTPPKELPPCDGPKLRLFQHYRSCIQWLERLDKDDEDEDKDSPTEGYVFRAKIRDTEYAIKVFKFHDPRSDDYFWEPLVGEEIGLQTVAYYTDPFYAECRAYGRIQEAIEKGYLKSDIVVPCHGFFFLRETDEKVLQGRNIDLDADQVDPEYQRATPGGYRPRAIVKDLASADPSIDQDNLKQIIGDIARLNSQPIFNMDIRLDNYRDGKLVGFGSSWTEPHILLDALDDKAADESRLADRTKFGQMLKDEKIPNIQKIRPVHPMRLRRRI